MAQGFYSLEEAANLLSISVEELSQKAQRQEVRAFADKGTWRFKADDIDALAQGGMAGGSSNEFDIGEPEGSSEFDVGAPPDSGYISLGPPTSGSALNLHNPGGSSLPNAFDASSEFDATPESGSGSDFDLTMEGELPGFGGASGPLGGEPQGVLRLADSGLMPTADLNLGNVLDEPMAPPAGDDLTDFGAEPSTPAAAGGSDVRLSLETGSFEFDLKVDSGGRLGEEPKPGGGRKTTGGPVGPSTGGLPGPGGGDDEVHLDFDSSTIDDSMLLVGEQRPDSDVRIEPMSMARPSVSGAIPQSDDLMRTEEIDLDAELRKAEEMSRLGKRTGGDQFGEGKTQLPGPSQPTMLPDLPANSPFELSEEDLQLPQGSKRGGMGTGSGSEFELTLAPDDDDMMSPLNLGDDEDVDLGAAPSRVGMGSGRAELSGINLGRPAESGVSLEQGGSSDRVDFELTLDDDATAGPKTISGKAIDSDSEFELTIDDSLVMKDSPSGAQQDIFEETDFDMAAPSSEDSGSQAVALDDTDLESSDFDLAIEDSSSTDLSVDDSSELMVMDDEGSQVKTKVHAGDIGEVDSLFDEELVAPEPEPEMSAREEEEMSPAGVPAAQAEWGIVPVILLAPCVVLMMLAGMMSFELLHGMWGYRQSTPQGGILVSNLSALFSGEEAKER